MSTLPAAFSDTFYKELCIKMTIGAWEAQNKRLDTLLSKLSDEQLAREVAPGRNSGVYLLGHLAAVNDGIIVLLGFGEKLFPWLDPIFLTGPDKSGLPKPAVAELKKCWLDVNAALSGHMANMEADQWFTRHTAVSEADFEKEPHRNKLSILISRTSHQSYHLGQMAFL